MSGAQARPSVAPKFEPYRLPARKRPGRVGFLKLTVPKLIKYKYLPVDPVLYIDVVGKRHSAIISCMVDVSGTPVNIMKKFMETEPIDPTSPDMLQAVVDDALPPNTTLTPDEITVRHFIIGFAMTCHLGKPIDLCNKSYIHKRLVALGHSVGHIGFQTLTEMSVNTLIDIDAMNEIRTNLLNCQAVIGILENALQLKTERNLSVGLRGAYQLVFEGYGMTAVQEMEYFCTIVTRAHLMEIVLDEALMFKDILLQFKERHGDLWKYGRLLKLEGITDLEASKYPHLYTAAMGRAKGPNGTEMKNFKVSSFPLKEPASVIIRAANIRIR